MLEELHKIYHFTLIQRLATLNHYWFGKVCLLEMLMICESLMWFRALPTANINAITTYLSKNQWFYKVLYRPGLELSNITGH